MRFLTALFLSFLLCAPTLATAQEKALSPPELSPSGQDYLKAVRYRGIDTDVVYFDPSQPPPPLDTKFSPAPEEEFQTVSLDTDWTVGIIAALVLAVLTWILYLSVGRTSVSFRSGAGNAKRVGKPSVDTTEADEELPDLDAILRQEDRNQAVVGLAQLVLTRCLTANEVLFKRSWTHREALRSLPQSLWYIPDLRALVLESERVHFGHRSISDPDFNALLARIRPILREVRA